jgi:hypothetical protein
MTRQDALWVDESPICDMCDSEALTADDEGHPLCARHATIFLTADRIAEMRSRKAHPSNQVLTPADRST